MIGNHTVAMALIWKTSKNATKNRKLRAIETERGTASLLRHIWHERRQTLPTGTCKLRGRNNFYKEKKKGGKIKNKKKKQKPEV